MRYQRIGTALIFMGASLGLNRYYFVLHELWAGMLIALSLGLHRPGRKWLGAVLAAGLALACPDAQIVPVEPEGWDDVTRSLAGGAIVGVGAARRVSAVRWSVARGIVFAWFITMPMSGLIAFSAG